MKQQRCGELGDPCQVAQSWVWPCPGPAPHCTRAVPGPVLDAENFLVGAPPGDLQGPLSPLAQQEALSAPQEAVEVGSPQDLPGPGLQTEPY